MDDWVSVKDRLPKECENVKMLLDNGDIVEGHHSGRIWHCNGGWDAKNVFRIITHWKPLLEQAP